ncbi:hypothetical protein D9758_007976 [Tetrapyrgos nigripes]|uniref:Uncharacterized protein n=1 Tax=Tetrapyrgos nigripes TaxID=182062 RepID=A0A8H5D1F1_9AGAR|nr:hypothetical protein D9758_007976 [Tetrapyrgos nigripes]
MRLRSTKRFLKSVIPSKLTSNDYCDLSDIVRPLTHYKTTHFKHYYDHPGQMSTELQPYVKFPQKTRGFYYYHVNSEKAPGFAGGLRFRVCSSKDPESFHEGKDLLKLDGSPWEISNWAFASLGEYHLMGKKLVKDGVIRGGVLKLCRKLASRAKISNPSQPVVYSLKQPFPMVMGRSETRIWIADEERLGLLSIHNDLIHPFVNGKYDGRAKFGEAAQVCFDLEEEEDNLVLKLVSLPPKYFGRTDATGVRRHNKSLPVRKSVSIGTQTFRASEVLDILRNSAYRHSWTSPLPPSS